MKDLEKSNFVAHIMKDMFHFEFLDQLSSFFVGYKNESNNANDSKKGTHKSTLWYIIKHIEATRTNQLQYSNYI